MNHIKSLKEAIFIIIISSFIGIIVNFINPKGISLIMNESKYSLNNNDSLKKILDDTSGSKTLVHKLNKEGFYEPVNIKLDVAKVLFDRGALFIDARTLQEYSLGRIKGAINIPYEEYRVKSKDEKLKILEKYDKGKLIVCYCSGGNCEVSIDLAYEIAKIGYNKLYIYLGGFKEWESAGYPVEK